MAPAPIVMWSATPDLTAQHGKISHRHAARYADLGDDQAMPSDRAVVSDLDEIVDLGSLADDRIARRAAVDRGIGADFDVVLNDDAPGLRDLLMASRRRQITETVLADANAGMDDNAVADQGVDDSGSGADRAVAADADIGTDHGAGRDHGAGADLRARTDHRERIDGDVGLEPRGVMHVRCSGASADAVERRWTQHGGEQRPRSPRQTPDKDAASPARQLRAAPKPQNAAQSGRLRRACRPDRRDISNCREKLDRVAVAVSSGAMLPMRRSGGSPSRNLARVSAAISPIVNSRSGLTKSGIAVRRGA